MKRIRFILAAIFSCYLLSVAFSSAAQAESRFAEGFRGVAWGNHKDQLPDLGLSKKALKNIYKSGPSSVLFMEGKGNLDLKFDSVPLLSIFMHFNNQRFTGVDLLFEPKDRETVVSIITLETGAATFQNDREKRWLTDRVNLVVTDRELMVTVQEN